MTFLTLDRVSHHYFSKKNHIKTLDNISFSVKEGEIVTLLGPNGCGKSTILSIIAGIIKQSTGEVLIQQQPINKSEPAIGYMLQQDYLFPWKTIIDNVLIGPKIGNNQTEAIKGKASYLLEEAGLINVTHVYPSSLSRGMRQRVALIRTLITDPKIILLDEPFSILDYQTKVKLEDLMLRFLKMYNKTTILVTHDIGEAIAMSDRIILMDANTRSIEKTFEVPLELRDEAPFSVRRHPKYQLLFEKIWQEIEPNTPGTKIVGHQNDV
ncbi:NitT/TauT family transport system ATP-binding protein [Virgibacillus subterraneus]|uniref:NitT/TauT family transport system ATP-binding protein n=1 Tax=Virgibacillus subterraneus TaxID=621109 RepID=A0A1H9C8A8_9BACI|nr:ABC transporter ATP-binding protein [Virgibacillus subterraneus]SEP97369.1 NitT/TauT family transport system ATP-binding protein [Virgibacillus subterraneus]